MFNTTSGSATSCDIVFNIRITYCASENAVNHIVSTIRIPKHIVLHTWTCKYHVRSLANNTISTFVQPTETQEILCLIQHQEAQRPGDIMLNIGIT